jgi:uncharacterized membrane protein YfcA
MLDAIQSALQTEGLIWLIIAVLVAGVVRGFSGFGSAMIIMPVASSVLSPVEAVIFLVSAEVLGPLPNLPNSYRNGAPRDIGLLILGAALMLPVGLWCLSIMEPTAFGWLISGIILALLVLMMTGWRYRGVLTRPIKFITGCLSGFMTGFAGIPGPPVIMLYMASTLPVKMIRANFNMYLVAVDVILFPTLWLTGQLQWSIVLLGLLAGIPYLAANVVGARLFNPDAERFFRLVAYGVIAAAALLGLPIWKG